MIVFIYKMFIFVTVKWKKWINDDLNNQTNPNLSTAGI